MWCSGKTHACASSTIQGSFADSSVQYPYLLHVIPHLCTLIVLPSLYCWLMIKTINAPKYLPIEVPSLPLSRLLSSRWIQGGLRTLHGNHSPCPAALKHTLLHYIHPAEGFSHFTSVVLLYRDQYYWCFCVLAPDLNEINHLISLCLCVLYYCWMGPSDVCGLLIPAAFSHILSFCLIKKSNVQSETNNELI